MNRILILALSLGTVAAAQETSPPTIVDNLAAEGERIAALMSTDVARDFAGRAVHLPVPSQRTLYRDAETGAYVLPDEWASLDADARAALESVELPADQYYTTKYGTPMAYARVVELMGLHGVTSLEGKRVLDYGYGTIGHLRMMASMGAETVGIDVDRFLPALYSEAGDLGDVENPSGAPGRTSIVTGRWPASKPVIEEVGGGFDVFTSKNTLKRGYVHPSRDADPSTLIDLGVGDAGFLAALHDCLEPGGLVVIYNICPPQNPADKPYIPWADGQSPFTRAQWDAAGFDVLAFSVVDDEPTRALATALGWGANMDVETSLHGWYTITRRR